MKIRISFRFLLLFLMFIFWVFIYPNHILFTEQLSLFLYTSGYWKEFALQPGGWAAYCGNFLAQFYINRWLGALIQTLLVFVLMVFSNKILRKAGNRGDLMSSGILPAMLLWALQCDHRFTPGDALALISPFAFALLYLNMRQVAVRRLVFTVAMVPIYLFSGATATFCLSVACMLYELLYAKDAWKYSTPAWIIIAVFLPYGWQSVYLMPKDGLFDVLSFQPVEGVKYLPHILLSLIPLSIIKFKVFFPQRKVAAIFIMVTLFALAGCGYYLFSKSYNRLEEQKFGMNLAAAQNNWDQVLKISQQVSKPDQHTAYYTNLALSMKGELPQRMFHYSQTDEYGLFLIHKDEFNLRYGSDFYYHINIMNEAIRWIFDAYILRGKGMDYHTLTRLAAWNKEGGYKQTAAKYFNILEGTLMYRSWAKQQRKAPVPQQEKSTVTPVEFYIGGREPVSDIARHYDNHPQNRMALDYVLCCLLLKNDPERFLKVFNMYYMPSQGRLPQAYQEALLLIAATGKIDIRNYPIDKINEASFQKFNDLAGRGKKVELKKQFGNTWWWYYFRRET